jgi:spore germination cell wall hydrolase CwlJ-like protein
MKKLLLAAAAALMLSVQPAQAVPMESMISSLQSRYSEDRQTLCMAINVYHEARGSTLADQRGVAWVVRNRAERSGRDYCREIWQPGQFSWTVRSAASLMPRESAAWSRSVDVAQDVMSGAVADPTGGATNFRAARMGGGRGYRVIGAHAYW